MLRFKNKSPREYRVPLNFRIGKVEIPLGLILILAVLLTCAITNLLTKETATKWGLSFTTGFMIAFSITEAMSKKHQAKEQTSHTEQFNEFVQPTVSLTNLGLIKLYRKLVAIRSPGNLYMLKKALQDSDPLTTDTIVMTAKPEESGFTRSEEHTSELQSRFGIRMPSSA